MSDRRRGMGFGNGNRVGPGNDYDDFEDDNVDATRAMDVFDDEMPPPTEMVQAPVPAPPPPGRARRPRPAPRSRPTGRPEPDPPEPLYDDDHGGGGDDNEDATRVLSTADLDEFNAAAAATAAPRRAAVTPIELHVVSGPDRGKVHRLSEGDALVGRGLDCDIVLADPAVSRKHFRVVRTGDDVDAIDMGGANGTNVNNSRISRHRLVPGDQIDVGTTVLEFRIDGVGAPRSRDDFPESSNAGPAGAGRGQAKGKSKVGLFIGLAAAGIIVLGGGGVAAWLVMGSGGDATSEDADKPAEADISTLIKAAKGEIDNEEWPEAVETLKKAKKLSPSNTDVKGMLAKAEEELEASEALEEGKVLLKKKNYKQAIEHFKEVPNSSQQFSDAQDAIKEAKVDMTSALLAAVRTAMEAGENDKAKKLLTQVLKIDPKHTEGKLLSDQLAGDDQAEGDKAGDKGGDKSGKGSAKSGKSGDSGQSADSALKRGLKAYHNREWSAAKEAFAAVAKGNYKKADRAKAARYLAGSAEVAAAFSTANTQQSPLRKAKAWHKAYAADKRVDGHFGAMLIKKLTAAYVTAGKQFYRSGRYPQAAAAVREAMNYDPENAEAMKLEDMCMSQAVKLLAKAKAQLASGHHAYAQSLARKVMGVLPSMDPRAAEARKIAKEAANPPTGGDGE